MWELQWGEEEKPTLLFLPKLCSGNAGPEDNLISVKARRLHTHSMKPFTVEGFCIRMGNAEATTENGREK